MKVDASAIEKNAKKAIKEFKSDNEQIKKAAKIIRGEIIEYAHNYKTFENKDIRTTVNTTDWTNRKQELAANGLSVHAKASGTNKSNMTFTGRLLRSIQSVASGGKITLYFKGKHNGYTENSKQTKKSDIYLFLLKLGFNPILGVTDSAKERIAEQFRQFLRRRK